jgi:hypothetical protein
MIIDELIDWLMRARGYPTNQTPNPTNQTNQPTNQINNQPPTNSNLITPDLRTPSAVHKDV